MDEGERLPCLSCRAPVDLTEPDCPHCGASLLVDVLLQRPPTDARVRYQLIKAVQLLAGAPPQWEIQRALSASPPALACGVTRAFAHAVLPILAQNGVRGSIERHAAPAQRRFTVRAVAGFVAAVVLLGVVLVGWQFVVQRLAPTPLRLTEKDLLPSGAPGRTVAPARG